MNINKRTRLKYMKLPLFDSVEPVTTVYVDQSAINAIWASLVAQLVKSLPAIWETWVRSLGWEDPLENGTATHSGVLS